MKFSKFHLILLSVTSGIILSLGWPERGFPGLLFVGLVPMLMLEEQRNVELKKELEILNFRKAVIVSQFSDDELG